MLIKNKFLNIIFRSIKKDTQIFIYMYGLILASDLIYFFLVHWRLSTRKRYGRSHKMKLFVCLFVYISVFRPTSEFFTHMETSQLPAKGSKF